MNDNPTLAPYWFFPRLLRQVPRNGLHRVPYCRSKSPPPADIFPAPFVCTIPFSIPRVWPVPPAFSIRLFPVSDRTSVPLNYFFFCPASCHYWLRHAVPKGLPALLQEGVPFSLWDTLRNPSDTPFFLSSLVLLPPPSYRKIEFQSKRSI